MLNLRDTDVAAIDPTPNDSLLSTSSAIPHLPSEASTTALLSVQEMLDQEEVDQQKQRALSTGLGSIETGLQDERPFASYEQSKAQSPPVPKEASLYSSLPDSADTGHLMDSLEASINQLDAVLQGAPVPEGQLNPDPPLRPPELEDEPFFIAFPYSQSQSNKVTPLAEVIPESPAVVPEFNPEPTTSVPSSVIDPAASELLDVVAKPQSDPVKAVIANPYPAVGEDLETKPVFEPGAEPTMGELPALIETPTGMETSADLVLEEIGDPLAELSKLTEQFSLAAKSLQIPPESRDHSAKEDLGKELVSPNVVAKVQSHPTPELLVLPAPIDDTLSLSHRVRRGELHNAAELAPAAIDLAAESASAEHSPEGIAWSIPGKAALDNPSPSASSVKTNLELGPVEFNFDVKRSLNRLQQARGMLKESSTWQMTELDRLLEEQQNKMTQSVQVSFEYALRGLADSVDVQEVFADQNIVQRVLSVLSILPVQQNISAVQQHLLIFIDLVGPPPSEHQLHLAGGFLAQICGNIQLQAEMTRITVPSSLLRMQMQCYKRHEDFYAVPLAQLVEAHQFSHEEAALQESTMWDVHGAIDGPHYRIDILCGANPHRIYCFEMLGQRTMNLFEDLPNQIITPAWFGGVGVDGQNQVYHCVFVDRYAS